MISLIISFAEFISEFIFSLCLSLIYCLSHVQCFRFFLAANIDAALYKLHITSAVLQATTMASVSSMLRKTDRLSTSYHIRDWINHQVWFCVKQVWSKFAAGLRPAFDPLATRSRKSATTFSTRFAACQLARTSESETIRKPPLVKAKTALKTK